MTYRAWLKRVDGLLMARSDHHADDFAHIRYRDYYNNGDTPEETCEDITELEDL